MKAGSNGTASAPWCKYVQCDSSDLIYGTKYQLQALGLGVGLAFPGEAGGPKRKMQVHDPRGYPVKIEASRYTAPFIARVTFPHFPEHPNHERQWQPFCAGVKRHECYWVDEYIGAACALVAAGLVAPGHFPGMPGMRKVCVTVFADGSLPGGAPTANHARSREPGARTIEKASATTYRVRVKVPEAEGERRLAASRLVDQAWQLKVRALPRPAMLTPGVMLATPARSAAPRPTTRPRRGSRPSTAPLFGETPAAKDAQAYAKHVFDTLRDLVDFTQTSAY